ncbi:FRG domain-containing protein [Sphingobacterium psychroaquaticum]|uniref:FRG domain-containing protein n=1 Tax=Sphingobacterium psychroaquaticum TaxID=561061 RepID=A0A1X7JUS0_9SPHI|nr:FRG domain-containing protein [Sphingobacterium psychroaquaticum]SMG32131.1 FRG domain-containing protein [Sphingobacterium psychroaquaticum]
MNTEIIESITQYIDKVKSIDFGTHAYSHYLWFRAENSKYEDTCLTPNLYREYIQNPNDASDFHKKDASIRGIFKNEAYQYLKEFDIVNNDLGTTFIMQHYGSHTRLLDWTENSLISLFFAVEDTNSKNNALIWILDPFILNSETTKIVNHNNTEELKLYASIDIQQEVFNYFDMDMLHANDEKIQYPIALKPFYIDERMKRQSSCFTLFGCEINGLTKHPSKENFLKKIIIPFQHFRQIKKDLYKLGFSYDSVYPGLEGISKKIVYAINESLT